MQTDGIIANSIISSYGTVICVFKNIIAGGVKANDTTGGSRKFAY